MWFYPLKDSSATVQLVVPPEAGPDTLELMQNIPVESTVLIEGIVSERPSNQKRSVSHPSCSTYLGTLKYGEFIFSPSAVVSTLGATSK